MQDNQNIKTSMAEKVSNLHEQVYRIGDVVDVIGSKLFGFDYNSYFDGEQYDQDSVDDDLAFIGRAMDGIEKTLKEMGFKLDRYTDEDYHHDD